MIAIYAYETTGPHSYHRVLSRSYPQVGLSWIAEASSAIERAKRFAGATNIVIPMSYQLALL